MMLLDISKLTKLEEQFKKHADGIELMDFIELMTNELPHDMEDKINLVYGLYKLFLEIDFNGDGMMQWEEFTQFIIDTVMGENDSEKLEEEDEYLNSGKDLTEKQLTKFKRYQVNRALDDKVKQDRDIIDSAFMSKVDCLFISEYNSRRIQVINPRTGKLKWTITLEGYLNRSMADKPLRKVETKEKQADTKRRKRILPKIEVEKSRIVSYSILSIAVSTKNIVIL